MAATPAARHRLFADDYSSSGQRAWKDEERGPAALGGEPSPDWRRDFLGQMRFDSLVSRRLVVPDTHLIDGVFFAATPPRVLRRELGRPESRHDEEGLVVPIVFRLRAPTLAQTLSDFLVQSARPTLNAFRFKSIQDRAARTLVARELGRRDRTDLEGRLNRAPTPAYAIAELLRDCARTAGVAETAEEDIDRLEAGWSYWIEDESVVSVERYQTDVRFRPGDAVVEEPLDAAAEGYGPLAAAALAETEGRLLQGDRRRSAISEILDRHRERAVDARELAHLDEIDDWYSRARYRAIARQHGAVFVQLWQHGRAVGPLRRLYETVATRSRVPGVARLELPEEVIAGLADLDDAEWRRYLAQQRRSLFRWWETGREGELKRALSTLVDVLHLTRETRTAFGMVVPDTTVAGAVGAGAALLAAHYDQEPGVALPLVAGATYLVLANEGGTKRRVMRRIVDAARRMTP
jgi:hypothetical protein